MEQNNNRSTRKIRTTTGKHYFGKRGFTLVEIMVVMAIIAIIVLFAGPQLIDFGPNMRVKAAARDLHSNLQKMKIEAIKRNRDVVMEISVSPANFYKIFIDESGDGNQVDPEEWLDFADDSNDASPDTDYDMPKNSVLTSSTSAKMGFNSLGLLLDPTNVETVNGQEVFLFTLNNDRGRTYTVSITLAGGINTKKI